MNVLLLTQVLPFPPDSGPKVKTWNLLKCVAREHAVTLVSFVRGDQSEDVRSLAPLCREVHTVPIRRNALSDIEALVRSLATKQPFLMVRDDQPAMRRLVDRLATSGRYDLVHADQLNMAQYADRVPSGAKLLDAHNALWLLYRRLAGTMRPGPARLLLERDWRLLRAYEGEVYRRFDAVLAVSGEDRRALEEAAGAPLDVTVVPIAVDAGETPPVERRPGAPHVLHLGTMYWPPNVDAVRWFAREIHPLVRARVGGAELDVVGARPPRAIRALARRGAGINLAGYVRDPLPYLERAGAFVVPLRAGGGMRVKILQALAQALPVVTTRLGCEGIEVEDGRHLLMADGAAEFAAATVRLLQDENLARDLGRNGRRLIEERYDYRVVGPCVLTLYSRLSGRSAVSPRVDSLQAARKTSASRPT